MAWQIIKDPMGTYAIWDTISDDIIYINLTKEDVIIKCVFEYMERTFRTTHELITALEEGKNPYGQCKMTWNEAVEKRNKLHNNRLLGVKNQRER